MQPLLHVSDLTQSVVSLYRKNIKKFLLLLVWVLIPTVFAGILPVIPLATFTALVVSRTIDAVIAVISLCISVLLVDATLECLGKKSSPTKRAMSLGMVGRVVDFALVSLLQGIVVAVGILLFIVPGLLFWNWFSFARYAVLVDGSSPGKQALATSRDLVRGRFWTTAWRWIGSYLYFGSIISLGTVAVLGLVGAVLGNPFSAFGLEPTWWGTTIVDIIAVITTPLFVTIGVLLYEDAKRTQ